jgi:hypothetical protein
MKHIFQAGDQVRIQRDYWEKLAKDKNAIKLYVKNGPDYVYTVSKVRQDGAVVISYLGDNWVNPQRYLELVSAEENADMIVPALADIL